MAGIQPILHMYSRYLYDQLFLRQYSPDLIIRLLNVSKMGVIYNNNVLKYHLNEWNDSQKQFFDSKWTFQLKSLVNFILKHHWNVEIIKAILEFDGNYQNYYQMIIKCQLYQNQQFMKYFLQISPINQSKTLYLFYYVANELYRIKQSKYTALNLLYQRLAKPIQLEYPNHCIIEEEELTKEDIAEAFEWIKNNC